MKNFSENRLFSTLLFFLTVGVIVKIIWLAISIIFLPKSGVEHIEISKAKALYYRVKLANPSKKVIIQETTVKKPIIGTMKGIKLIALYHASDALVVTVEKAKKTKVLSRDDKEDNSIDGFILSSAGPDYAIFKKNGKEFKLAIEETKIKNSSYIRASKSSPKPKKEISDGDIVENKDGVGKIVSKGLLSSYTKDINKVWKDIGIGEYKINGQLQGFKVNFVKKGSDFEKLGLKRGDVLKSVNGQELNSYKSAYSFYGEMSGLENLTLGIKRNNQDMELEYEIK